MVASDHTTAPSLTKNHFRHGMANTPEYRSWQDMHSRCSNPKDISFANYGGRGIAVCARWSSFPHFYADMGARPGPNYSLDRYPDNNGDYSPGNCRWATQGQQLRNTRRTRNFTLYGMTKCLKDWCHDFGKEPQLVSKRLKLGWTIEDALTMPVDTDFSRPSLFVTLDGITKPLSAWRKVYGIQPTTVLYRIKHGWTLEEALTTPVQTEPLDDSPLVTLHDETKHLNQWRTVYGLKRTTVDERLKRGWTIEQALMTPVGHPRSMF